MQVVVAEIAVVVVENFVAVVEAVAALEGLVAVEGRQVSLHLVGRFAPQSFANFPRWRW